MIQERGLTVRGNADLIESRESALSTLETHFALAVRQRELLEKYIRERLHPNKHFYTVGDDPGRKPSLTKEGAELICLPHVLKPRYTILSGPDKPPPDNTPYQLTVLCGLYRNDIFEGEGIGSASSYITKKDETYQPRQKDPGLCYNATIKMGQKSAYIAATLNSTAASEFFTQDLEDDQTGEFKKQEQKEPEHWCKKHNTRFFKTEKMKAWAHPVKNADGSPTLDDNGKPRWCSKKIEKPQTTAATTSTPDILEKTGIDEESSDNGHDETEEATETDGRQTDLVDWVIQNLPLAKWSQANVITWMRSKANYMVLKYAPTFEGTLRKLTPEQAEFLQKEILSRIELA